VTPEYAFYIFHDHDVTLCVPHIDLLVRGAYRCKAYSAVHVLQFTRVALGEQPLLSAPVGCYIYIMITLYKQAERTKSSVRKCEKKCFLFSTILFPGIFRAPVPGIYLFSWSVTARRLSGGSAYDIWSQLQHNGVHIVIDFII